MGAEGNSKGQSRRGRGIRRALVVVLGLALLAGGCGEGDSTSESEKAADAELLNAAIDQELVTIAAYEARLPLLRGSMREVGREFLAQGQEHVSALTKGLRGLGAEVEADESQELVEPAPRNMGEALALAYALENEALVSSLDAVPMLSTAAPRTLAASIAASHAQHLVVLRQALGADLVEAAPEAFEPGDLPPPGADTQAVDEMTAEP